MAYVSEGRDHWSKGKFCSALNPTHPADAYMRIGVGKMLGPCSRALFHIGPHTTMQDKKNPIIVYGPVHTYAPRLDSGAGASFGATFCAFLPL